MRYSSNLLLLAFRSGFRNCSTTASGKGRTRRGLICQPTLPSAEVANVESILGLHIGPSYVSWVTIEVKKNEITHMGMTNFPEDFERMNMAGLSQFASQSVRMLPKANFYVMEEAVKAVSGTASRNQLIFQSSRMQYVAMLVALLNFEANAEDVHKDRVLFLKNKLAARLFGLIVGTEIVSSTKLLNDFMNQNVPPRFSTLQCSSNLKSEYFSRSRIDKEIIGSSLMTAVTFLELVVRSNEKCLEFVGISSVPSDVKKSKKTEKKVASNVNE